MPIEELSYRDYWRILLRHRLLVLGLGFLGALIGLGVARLGSPRPIYGAQALVRYDPKSPYEFSPDLRGVIPPPDLTFQVMFARSTSVLGNAARRLKLIPEGTRDEDFTKYPAELASISARLFVNVDPKVQNGLIYFGTTAYEPEEAADVANAAALAYREQNLIALRQDLVQRHEYIQNKLDGDERRLNEAQLAYELYRREHPSLMLEPGTAGAISALAAQQAAGQGVQLKIDETNRQLALVNSGRPISDLGLEAIVGGSASARLTQLSRAYTDLTLGREQLLTELTEAHPAVQQKEQLLDAVRRNLEDELNLILEAYEKQAEWERAKLEELTALESKLPAEAMELARLARQVKLQENLVLQLRAQLQDTLIKEAGISGNVSIVQLATPLRYALNPPKYLSYGPMGFGAGAFLGLVLAMLMESSRFSRATMRDIEEQLETPVLSVAQIVSADTLRAWLPGGERPEEGSPKWNRALALSTLFAPRSPVAEAYRTLRAALMARRSSDRKPLVITSSLPGEGVTTTALNLALSFAQAGQRVLLIESDFRNPAVSDLLGVVREPGLADWLLGSCSAEQATRGFADFVTGTLTLDEVVLGPGMDHLHVMPCGHLATTSEDLLGSETLRTKLVQLQEEYDLVILDCPALASAADALILGRWADVLVVFDPRRAERADLAATVSQLRKADCGVIGLFVNGMEASAPVDEPEERPPVAAAG